MFKEYVSFWMITHQGKVLSKGVLKVETIMREICKVV